jgi:hypothetical protein
VLPPAGVPARPLSAADADSLLRGDLLAAARFNASGLADVVRLAWAYVGWTCGRLTGRRIASRQHHRWSAAVTLSLVLVWFVVRNIPFAPFTGLYV